MTLKASCKSEISDFDFAIDNGSDWEDDVTLDMNYTSPTGASAHPTRLSKQAPYGSYSNKIGPTPICFQTKGLVEEDDSDRAERQ